MVRIGEKCECDELIEAKKDITKLESILNEYNFFCKKMLWRAKIQQVIDFILMLGYFIVGFLIGRG